MKQVIVGGDNQEANRVYDVFETKIRKRGLPILLCTTYQEVLSSLSRGGADLVVLAFEQAGLTNFEIAHRIREMGPEGTVPILLPDIDALGDIRSTLGGRSAVFEWPIDPKNIAVRAKQFLDAAERQENSPDAAGKAAAGAVSQPSALSRVPQPDLQRTEPIRATVTSDTDPDALATAGGDRSHRVRHWTRKELQRQRTGSRSASTDSDQLIDDEDIVVLNKVREPAERAKLRLAFILFGVAAVIALGYGLVVFGLGLAKGERDPGLAAELICTGCGFREHRITENIHEILCRKCGKPMGFAFRCNDCKEEFGFIPGKKTKTIKQLKTKPECSNCNSWNIKQLQ